LLPNNVNYLALDEDGFNELLEVALISNRPEIVELIIGYDSNLNSFLNKERLEKLYNNQIVYVL